MNIINMNITSMKSRLQLPHSRIFRPKVGLIAVGWILSMLLMYLCAHRATNKYINLNVERASIHPKESPPLLAYILLQRFYSPSVAQKPIPTTHPSFRVTYEDIEKKLEKPRCTLYNDASKIPELEYDTDIPHVEICVHKKTPALVTLFTTMYERKDKLFIFNNTINYWPHIEGMKPVLFLTPLENNNPKFVKLIVSACNQGWDVLVAPHCNDDMYPVLRSMWQIVLRNYPSQFYGFTNGDMLFDETLPITLNHLLTHEPHIFKRRHLISGQRHNVFIPDNAVLKDSSEVRAALYNSSLHSGLAIDYFFTTRDGFPWHTIPAFVIGRPQFDNWLLWNASIDARVLDIDATETILGLHVGLQGQPGSWSEINISVDFNKRLALAESPQFSVMHGCTYCQSYRLMNTVTSILLVPRHPTRHQYTCTVDAEEHIAFLQMRLDDEALLTAYSKTVLSLDMDTLQMIRKAAEKTKKRIAASGK